jgi:predicted MFS family arabinose efflux permease
VTEKKPPSLPVELGALTVSRLIVNTGLRMVYPFLPVFARGLGVSLAAVASLVAIRGFVSLLSPLFGPLSERYGRRPVLALSMLVFGLGCAVVVIWPHLWAFGLSLAVIAIAKIVFDPAMQAFLGDTVPYARRGQALAVTELSWAGAFFVGIPIMGFVIKWQGWQAPFAWLGVLAVGAAIVLWRLLPKTRQHSDKAISLRPTLALLRKEPVVWAASAYVMLLMAANELILVVYGDWMEVSFGLTVTSLGLASIVIGTAELTGELTTAFSVDRVGKRRFVIITGSLAALTYLTLPFASVSLAAALISLFVLFLFFEMSVVGGVPLMTEIVPSARSIVLSLIVAAAGLGRALGALVGPALWSSGNLVFIGLASGLITAVAVVILALWVYEGEAGRRTVEVEVLE